MTPSDLEQLLDAHPDIANVDAVFVDLDGHLRGKRLPREKAAEAIRNGVMIPQAIMALTTPGECLDAGGRGISDGDPDGAGAAVAGSAVRLPWSDRTAQVLLRMNAFDGEPLGCDPRNVLDGVVARLAALGLRPVMAFELEFYVIAQQRAADGGPLLPERIAAIPAGARSHGTPVLDALAPFFQTVEAYADAMDIRIGGVTTETGLGQFEINLHHGDQPGRAADEVILLRQILWNAARTNGLDVTFMAKPFADQPGDGLHLHLSLIDGDGRNIFGLDDGDERLRHAIGGIRDLMPAAMALQAPNLNSFRRFVPGSFAPINRTWGRDNRSVAFRIPMSKPEARRIEHRIAGGDANPYLVAASVLASVIHGLENRIDPGASSTGNANLIQDDAVPTDVLAALDLLTGSAEMRRHLGSDYVDLYADIRRKELRRLLGTHLPKEYEWYL